MVTLGLDTVQRVQVELTRVVGMSNNSYDNNSRDNKSSSYSLMNACKKNLSRKGITSAIFDRQSKCILACLKLHTCRVKSYTWSSGKCDLSRMATKRNKNATTNEIEINDIKTSIVCD